MNEFKLRISTPDGDVYNGEAVFLSLRGSEGDLGILAGHIPFITIVKPGRCRVEAPNESASFSGRINGGILSVSKECVTLLCDGLERDAGNEPDT